MTSADASKGAGKPRKGFLRRLGRPSRGDWLSGAATGLFSIPEGMAYASIAGFNPVSGLFAGVVPTIVGSLTARTVLMITTLSSAIALTSQSVLSDAGLKPGDFGNVALLSVMVGAVMLLMGVARLGAVMSFVSNAVMVGFSTGIALQIITGILADATGYKPEGHNKLYQFGDWIVHVGGWNLKTTLVAAGTIAVWFACRLVKKLKPYALLIALAAVSAVVVFFGITTETVRDLAGNGGLPAALPKFTMPDFAAAPHLVAGAISVALVALAQAASISPSMPNPDGSRSDMNADFRAQGWANIFGGFFQALPAGGSMSRTGVAVEAGARTRWAGVISGLFLGLVVLTLAPVANRIPIPVIGGLILVVGGEIIWGKWSEIILISRTSVLSTVAMVITFLATTQLPLQQAVIIGAVLSLLLYCVQAARQGDLIPMHRRDGNWIWGDRPPAILPSGEVTVLYYSGMSFFAELPRLERQLPELRESTNAVLILVLATLPDVPSSAFIDLLTRWKQTLDEHGNRLVLAGVRPRMYEVLEHTGILPTLGEDAIFREKTHIFEALSEAVDASEAWIDKQRHG